MMVPASSAQSSANDGVTPPHLLTRVNVRYPEEAKAQHLTGKVVLHFTITAEGDVADITVVSGQEVFQQAAIEAVKSWKFSPAVKDGKPIEIDTNTTVNFGT